MVIVAIMLCGILGLIYYFTKENMEALSVQTLQSAMIKRPPQTRSGDLPADIRLPFFILNIDENDEITAIADSYHDFNDEAYLRNLTDAALIQDSKIGVLEEESLRFFKKMGAEGMSIVFTDISGERAMLRELAQTCVCIGAVCFIAFFFVSLFLVSRMLRPVKDAWQQQRRFIADASHELKTPLTVIMANAEQLQSSKSAAQSLSERILKAAVQMRALVENLLELAKSDEDRLVTRHQSQNFSDIVELAILNFEPVFFERHLKLETSITPDIYVNGDSEQLDRLVQILLDNVQKYAPADDTVTVALQKTDARKCRLSISNACAPLTKEEIQNLFKRFYRLDEARTRDGSFGLGLSISQGIASAHNGIIDAKYNEGRIVFTVELPALK